VHENREFRSARKKPVHIDFDVDGLRKSVLCEESADCFWSEETFAKFLVFVVFQTILKLAERFINCLDRLHAMPAKIMRGVLQVLLGSPK
jgi:hypothetical protein